jgi:AraC-like DNA-binding protein
MISTLKATRIFKDPAFPLYCQRHENHVSSTLHRHDFHELVVILSGHGRHIADDEDYPVQAGDVFLIRGNMAHGYAETDRMALANILFNPRQIKLPLEQLRDVPGYHMLFRIEPRLLRRDRIQSRLRLSADELAEAVRMIIEIEDELARKEPGHRFMACACLMRLIAFLSRCYSHEGGRSETRLMRMGELLGYIERHYRESITIEQLRKRGCMSESTLLRSFRRVLGHSPIEHVIRLRVAHAEDLLLRREDMRITEVAFESGFLDSNYFSRQFRRITGMSPSAYRARYGTMRNRGTVSLPGHRKQHDQQGHLSFMTPFLKPFAM